HPCGGDVIGGRAVYTRGRLPVSREIPASLRYADPDLEVVVFGSGEPVDPERSLAQRIRKLGESDAVDDLTAAVVALDAVDHCFRESGLWRGHIYLAGAGALAAVLEIVGVEFGARWRCRSRCWCERRRGCGG